MGKKERKGTDGMRENTPQPPLLTEMNFWLNHDPVASRTYRSEVESSCWTNEQCRYLLDA